MTLTIIGTAAFDGIETPKGKFDKILGGSAVYAAVAASIWTKTGIVSIVGQDFTDEYRNQLTAKNINIAGLAQSTQNTFYWKGFYEADMNQAHTRETHLNCLTEFDPVIPESLKQSRIVFLANVDPNLQIKALNQFTNPEWVILDTMNYWITSKKESLIKAIQLSDILIINDQEIRLLTGKDNIINAMPDLLALGPKVLIVKKGEHGAVMTDGRQYFAVPALPIADLTDPTGAGDSFAGAFSGYLDTQAAITSDTIKKALIVGTLAASYTVQGFGLTRLAQITKPELTDQLKTLKQITEFPSHIL